MTQYRITFLHGDMFPWLRACFWVMMASANLHTDEAMLNSGTRRGCDELQSDPLMMLGVVVAAASFVTFILLFVLLIGVFFGLAVPVLGMLPSASAATFAIEVVAVGSFEDVGPLKALAAPLVGLSKDSGAPFPPDSVLWSSFLFLTAVWLSRRARAALVSREKWIPRGVSPGAWELRALGFVAFPLTRSSTQLLLRLDEADSPLAGFLLSTVLLCFLLNQAASTWGFVKEVLQDGRVVRTVLPEVCVGDQSWIFVDKTCDELSSMPINSSQGLTANGTISAWMKTPGWCFAHPLAAVQALNFPEEMVFGPKVQKAHEQQEGSEDELADLLQDQGAEQSFSAAEFGSRTVFHGGPSEIKICHPISVRSKFCYDSSMETVAGPFDSCFESSIFINFVCLTANWQESLLFLGWTAPSPPKR